MQQIPWEKVKVLEDEIKVLKKTAKPKKDPIEGILADAFKGKKITEKDLKDAEFKFDYNHIIYQRHKK